MKRKIFFLLAFLLVFTAGLALAQEAEAIVIDPGLAETIMLTGIGGMGVAALSEILKRMLLKLIPTGGKIIGLASAAVVSIGATWFYLSNAGTFSFVNLATYSVLVFGLATGLYKFTTKHNT